MVNKPIKRRMHDDDSPSAKCEVVSLHHISKLSGLCTAQIIAQVSIWVKGKTKSMILVRRKNLSIMNSTYESGYLSSLWWSVKQLRTKTVSLGMYIPL